MLIPDSKGHYTFEGLKVTDYYAMVDTFDQVIEVFTTEDGRKWKSETNWDEMNDLEKHICRQRGWNLDEGTLDD